MFILDDTFRKERKLWSHDRPLPEGTQRVEESNLGKKKKKDIFQDSLRISLHHKICFQINSNFF